MTLQIPADGLTVMLQNRRVIDIAGPDAEAFLQAQLTADMAQVPAGQWRPGGYCSAKGRLLASGLLFRTAEGFAWLVADDLSAALVKRLRMFVLRLKVSIAIRAAGVIGRVGQTAVADHGVVSAQGPVSTWLGLSEVDGLERAFGIVPDEHTDAFLAALPAGEAAWSQWQWLEVRSGLSFIETATQDKFVPQMVNLEALGGVDFKKGCYPGQEVVARSQYLGKLKRRTLLAHANTQTSEALPMPGGDVYSRNQSQAVGTIVSAARAPDGGIDCLVEAPLAAWGDGIKLTADADLALEPGQLPYPLPDNEVFVRPRL